MFRHVKLVHRNAGSPFSLERERRTTDLVRPLQVPSLLLNDSGGCIIVTIALLENQEAGFQRRPETLVLYIYTHTDRVKRVGAEVLSTIVEFLCCVPIVRDEEFAPFSRRMTF